MKENKKLELRMYFFVPYNISPIQQAIQAGHSALEYAVKFNEDESFRQFAMVDKTWIILNGGTTNNTMDYDKRGSLNVIGDQLTLNGIRHSSFYEPDLNGALTAICFICDEHVWDFENYPDFICPELLGSGVPHADCEEALADWTEYMGGSKNLFLRELIRNKKLA